MKATALSLNPPQPYRVPLLERLGVWWRNLRNRRTARAYRDLAAAMKADPDYAHSWLCNIAMPIYDSTRPSCTCDFQEGHEPGCPIVRAHNLDTRPMSIEEANDIAKRLMRHLFGVDTD